MVRFIHTSDWHLGMSRRFSTPEAGGEFARDRFEAVRAIGKAAGDENCQFVVVCGDLFDSNLVDRKTVSRGLEALRGFSVPVYILPGNHDPLNAASVYLSPFFLENKPSQVFVIMDANPIPVAEGVQLVGAPWTSASPAVNPVLPLLDSLDGADGSIRLCAAHGIVDVFTPDSQGEGVMPFSLLEDACRNGKVHYIALGDRHSLTSVGATGRIWYAGSPEATGFRIERPGFVQMVEMDALDITVKEIQVGRWNFRDMGDVPIGDAGDAERLLATLAEMPDKSRTCVKVCPEGTVSLEGMTDFHRRIDSLVDLFAMVDVDDTGLATHPEDGDWGQLSGFAESARLKLEAMAKDDQAARDALLLLHRLTKGTP